MRLSVIGVGLALLASTAVAAEKKESVEKSFPSQAGKVVFVDGGPLDVTVRASDIQDIRLKIELVVTAISEKKAIAWLDAHRPTVQNHRMGVELHLDQGAFLRPVGADAGVIAIGKRLDQPSREP